MNEEREPAFTDLEELAKIPLSDLVEPEWEQLPPLEPEDGILPLEYLQELLERGVITQETLPFEREENLPEGPEREQSPLNMDAIEQEGLSQENESDFGR